MSAQPDPRAELGVPPNASAAEVHRAFRRRLREHHPDTRPQQDGPTSSASDQALQRALAAYQTLRHQAAPPSVGPPTDGEQHRADRQAPAGRSGSPRDAPLKATAVHWVPAAGTEPGHNPAIDRTGHPVTWPDWLIRWLLGQ
jgi:molecular chaperone DnaJ